MARDFYKTIVLRLLGYMVPTNITGTNLRQTSEGGCCIVKVMELWPHRVSCNPHEKASPAVLNSDNGRKQIIH